MKKIGIIGQFFQCFFWLLKYLPPQVFIEERCKHQNRLQGLPEPERGNAINRRMRIVDGIIISYVVIYILVFIFIFPLSHTQCLKCLILLILTLRLIDIIQVNVNIILFDALCIDKSIARAEHSAGGAGTEKAGAAPFIFSSIRSIILVSYNFLEIAIIFGFYYALMKSENLVSTRELNRLDHFYFSFITQLTIGYGDITPKGFYRFLAVVQGTVGYFFTILILSRYLGLLPEIKKRRDE